MEDQQIKVTATTSLFFLGIGGIGMSALARFFRSKGYRVAGFDRAASPLTKALEKEGITVVLDDAVEAIPEVYRDPIHTVVVWTPAIPQDHKQFVHFRESGFAIYKRSEMLGYVTRTMRALCVAGTHGKTTTSTILAHLLYQSEINCNAFLGGISNNYGTNFLLSPESNNVVIEADEYDHSFYHLHPYMSMVCVCTYTQWKKRRIFMLTTYKPNGESCILTFIRLMRRLRI